MKTIFKDFINNELIISSKYDIESADFKSTSGDLIKKFDSAYIDTYNFRMISKKFYNEISVLFKILNININSPVWSGFHLFLNYQDENNLYVASYRKDNTLTIKKKINGIYTTLVSKFFQTYTNTEVYIKFIKQNNYLKLYVNNYLELLIEDNDLKNGVIGIRTDYIYLIINYICCKII